MESVLAAIDDSTAAAPVIATARRFASVLDAPLEVLHVTEGAKSTAVAVAEHAGVPLRLVEGDPVDEIVRAGSEPGIQVIVVGTRGQPAGPRPAGHVAVRVIERTDRPVVVVPPDIPVRDDAGPLRRVLIPLEGTPGSSSAVAAPLRRLVAGGAELVGVHVFDAATAPRFWGEPGHAEQSWAAQFADRWCTEPITDFVLRRGSAPQTIVDVAHRQEVDLVALGWSQDLGAGRAAVVRALLTHSRVPVLLVPVVAPE